MNKVDCIHLAGKHLNRIIETKYRHLSFNSMEMIKETNASYLFSKRCEVWAEKRFPAELLAVVDKETGEVFDDSSWHDLFK